MNTIQHLRPATAMESESDPIRLAETRTMTPAEWSRIKDNPRQRDTEAHARRARHLRVFHPVHQKVIMARLPDGQTFKIDGHTRDFLWSKGDLDKPKFLTVEIWECDTVADVCELYRTFDNSGAAETVGDKMFGAFREQRPEFTSELLISQRFATAMRHAHEILFGAHLSRSTDIYDLLRYWMPELKLLDGCEPNHKRFPTGVTAGALITFRRRGPSAMPFWTAYAKDLGTKEGNEFDAVHALDRRVDSMRLHKSLSGRENAVALIGCAISAVESFRRNKVYTVALKQTSGNSLVEWIRMAKNTERTW